MRTIGLIGGMSFESTEVYYRLINEKVRDRIGGFASADLMMHSVNFADIVEMQKSGRWDLAADALSASARRLQAGGAECVLICTNTMHLVVPQVAAAVDIPLIHIIDETARALAARGLRRPLLLATRYTMEHGFYAERMTSLGIDVMVPEPDDRTAIHDIIFNELCAGTIRESSRKTALAMIDKAKAAGADCVILGCTEICLLLDPDALPLPGIDSAAVHAQAAVDFSLT
ncbi:amino acid racemase [Rhizobiales bacterium RZME27]|uniref:Amino acid racemase n=1 Tax=Endobacterium cereale TaxID=2663029 RepID=A0A6A8ADF2_9HYPH|nr:aspartate/glutamate racemase family protein [Endobacterium cereale]MEB2843298.1 aspartate/glutamate racemase family protein [Endobacterium cereale]MQY47256.1 amino acid racemase [Endobacterium cereale]